jgi:choline kinase
VTAAPASRVRYALILAAGNGDRFHNGTRQSKLLQPVLGQPLILRTLESARAAGVTTVEVVLGYQAERLRSLIESQSPSGLHVHFSYNPEWRLENGISVLAARDRFIDTRFALLMGDHLFEPHVLARLLKIETAPNESLLAVDSRPAAESVVHEATKVQMVGTRIVAIGKDLREHDALDTGMFVCSPALFAAIDAARADGDTTLSGGIRRLARLGLMRGIDIGNAAWYDIDTMDDLTQAEIVLNESVAEVEAEPA